MFLETENTKREAIFDAEGWLAISEISYPERRISKIQKWPFDLR
jgi:hypothetical protein